MPASREIRWASEDEAAEQDAAPKKERRGGLVGAASIGTDLISRELLNKPQDQSADQSADLAQAEDVASPDQSADLAQAEDVPSPDQPADQAQAEDVASPDPTSQETTDSDNADSTEEPPQA